MLSLDFILKATNGKLKTSHPNIILKGVSINTRTLKKGDVFIAIKGERFDGHKFVNAAIRRGAKVLVVSKRISAPTSVAVIKVANTTQALGGIARAYRQQFDIPVIAITGSAGKTTTKEMVAATLSSKFKVLKNYKTENNQIGVPLTLLQLRSTHKAAVIEIGTNQKGEIKALTKIVQPTIGILTNVGASHLKGLKTVAGVFKEKSDLPRSMPKKGIVIFNNDDMYLSRIKNMKFSHKLISYGIKKSAQYQAQGIQVKRQRELQFTLKDKRYQIQGLSQHNIYNGLSAICAGELLGISYNNINTNLNKITGQGGRQHIFKVGSITVIDDSYNANPISLTSAIETLTSFRSKGKKILVCADMLELGSQSRKWHEHMGNVLLESSVDLVLTHGMWAKYVTRVLCHKHRKAVHFSKLSNLNQRLKLVVSDGDVVLVKGSRSMKMERVVEFLKNKYARKKT